MRFRPATEVRPAVPGVWLHQAIATRKFGRECEPRHTY
jgi:hypothetical protein